MFVRRSLYVVVMFAICVLLLMGSVPESAIAVVQSSVESPSAGRATSPPNVAATLAKERRFRFNYQFDVTGLAVGQQVRCWLPIPQDSDYQSVKALTPSLPGKTSIHADAEYGNRILFVEATVPESGQLSFATPYEIVRKEVQGLADTSNALELAAEKKSLFLKPNKRVPIDGRPLDLLSETKLSDNKMVAVSQLYNLVDGHVTYNKDGTGWGNGDVLWVCDSKRGNCTDFHSLFISLARSQGIPSRFEIGFPIASANDGKVGGYHCWAWAFVANRGWIPVDISEADKHPELKEYYFGNITADRVTFSTGRDIRLVPAAAEGTLNYFVYPHIEVNEKTLPRKNIALHFSYADIPQTSESEASDSP